MALTSYRVLLKVTEMTVFGTVLANSEAEAIEIAWNHRNAGIGTLVNTDHSESRAIVNYPGDAPDDEPSVEEFSVPIPGDPDYEV